MATGAVNQMASILSFMTHQDLVDICQNSPERVINTARQMLDKHASDDEDFGMNQEDWEVVKPIIVKLWNNARDEVFKQKLI